MIQTRPEMTNRQRFGCLVALLGSITISSVIVSGVGFGSRGTKVDYNFMYKNQPAQVVHEDIRLGWDKDYRIEIGESTIYNGRLITDDKKLVTVGYGLFERYNVREYQPDEK